MDKEYRVPWGLKDGRLVKPENVPTGLACGCVCPACDGLLIAKNAGLKMEPHFSHSNSSVSCEGYIHETAKLGLAQMLRDAIQRGDPASMRGQFRSCGHPFESKNILRGISHVSVELRIKEPNIQPDLVLEGADGPAKTIEIVDKHPPELAVIQFAEQGIPLGIVEVHTPDDLDNLLSGFPITGVTIIVPAPCPTCKKEARQQEMEALEQKRREREADELVLAYVKPVSSDFASRVHAARYVAFYLLTFTH